MLPKPLAELRDEASMRRALEVAASAAVGEVPIGAVLFGPDGSELAAAANNRESSGDPTGHAEILAMRQAAPRHGDGWRLTGCTLVVTVEPCAMCAGAAVAARVGRIVFGAFEPRTGAVGSLWDVVRDPRLNFSPEVTGGVLAADGAALLIDFFRSRRLGGEGQELPI